MIFSKKPTPEKLERLALNWPTQNPTWLVVTMNQESFDTGDTSYSLEAHHRQGDKILVNQLKFSNEDKDELSLVGFENSKKLFAGKMENNKENQDFINSILFNQMKSAREHLVNCGKRAPLESNFNPKEAQGEEWLRVSLGLLTKALESVAQARKSGGDEVSHGLFFCGIHPNKNRFTYRLRLFNLDIEAFEDEAQSLRVLVYDKKKADSFDGLEPSLTMVFNDHKQRIINEFILLLSPLSKTLLF